MTNKHLLKILIMNHTGHSVVELDVASAEDRARAQALLDKLLADRFTLAVRALAGAPGAPPGDYRVVRSLAGGVDALAPDSEVLAIPQLKGG